MFPEDLFEFVLADVSEAMAAHAVPVPDPLPADSWHWSHPSVTVLPHVSAPTNRTTAAAIVAANIARYRQHGAIPAHVDRDRGY